MIQGPFSEVGYRTGYTTTRAREAAGTAEVICDLAIGCCPSLPVARAGRAPAAREEATHLVEPLLRILRSNQHRGQHNAPEYPAGPRDPARRPFSKKGTVGRSSHMSLITGTHLTRLIVVIVADQRGLARGPAIRQW